MRPTVLLDPYQVNKKTKKNGQQVNNNNKKPHMREPRHPWDRFCGFPPLPGALPSAGSDGDGLAGRGQAVYKCTKGKVRLHDVEHMNRLPLRYDRSIGRNDWSLLGAHVCSAIEACKQSGRLASM